MGCLISWVARSLNPLHDLGNVARFAIYMVIIKSIFLPYPKFLAKILLYHAKIVTYCGKKTTIISRKKNPSKILQPYLKLRNEQNSQIDSKNYRQIGKGSNDSYTKQICPLIIICSCFVGRLFY